jgi:hypothetical protein
MGKMKKKVMYNVLFPVHELLEFFVSNVSQNQKVYENES